MMRRERGKQQTNKPTNQNTKRKIAATINLSTIIKCCCREEKRREEKRREERDEKNQKNKKRKKNSYLGFVRENECSNGFCKNLAPGLLKIFKKKPISIPWSSHEHQLPFDFFLLHPAAVDCTHGYSACLCGDEDDDDNDAAVCVLAGLRD